MEKLNELSKQVDDELLVTEEDREGTVAGV